MMKFQRYKIWYLKELTNERIFDAVHEVAEDGMQTKGVARVFNLRLLSAKKEFPIQPNILFISQMYIFQANNKQYLIGK